MNYNYDDAFYRRVSEENEDKFGCSIPFEPPITSKITGNAIKICNTSELGQRAHATFLVEIENGAISLENEPCSSFDIVFGIPLIDDFENPENEAYIKFYMKAKIKVKSMVLYYDFTTLVAEVGGYIGMFLGMSLIDITILINTGLLKAVNMLSWNRVTR